MVRRRAAEKLLFLTPPNNQWRAVPSAVLRPLLDELAPDTAPRGAPVEVTASLEGEAAAVAGDETAPQPESRVTAAAEAVTARLQTLFPDPEPEPAILPPAPLGEPAELEAESPVEAEAETPAAEPAAHPEPALEATPEPTPTPEPELEPAPEAETAAELPHAEAVPAQDPPRIVIDDTAPFEFVPAAVQPIDSEAGDGLLAVVSLIILGLAFFAGGVFWALNARSSAHPTVFTPLLVGWLAGVAGVGFVAAAVFMLLQRVTRAADRRDNRPG
jgi:lysozyme